jgi:hypothetical protein
MNRILLAIIFSILVTGCGNPVTLEKDLRNEEDKRKESEDRAAALENEVDRLKPLLTNIYASTNYLWVFTGVYSSRESAQTQCDYIGYSLPDTVAFSEFQQEVLPRNSGWSEFSEEQFQLEDKEATTESGIVLCRIPRK